VNVGDGDDGGGGGGGGGGCDDGQRRATTVSVSHERKRTPRMYGRRKE
jgi:hypothetical protein